VNGSNRVHGWHAGADVIARYAGGSLDEARAASLEAHLLRCPGCRRELAGAAPPGRLAATWERVEDRLDRTAIGPVERFLDGLGVPDHMARLLAATPSLRASWFVAVAMTLGFAVSAAAITHGHGGTMLFLVVAPLIPLAGVAAAFGPGVDPTYEIGVAAPLRGNHLLLLRSVAVVGTSIVACAAASLALPGHEWTAAAWLLPALGLTAATLALSTALPPVVAGGAVAGTWIAGVILAQSASKATFAAFRAPGQEVFVAVFVASVLVLALRREAFDRKGTS